MKRIFIFVISVIIFSSCSVLRNISDTPPYRAINGFVKDKDNDVAFTYDLGFIRDNKGNVVYTYNLGFVRDTEGNVKFTYSLGFVKDENGEVVCTYTDNKIRK